MEPGYWRQRWQEGRTGWNEAQPNALLVRHSRALMGDAPPKRVIVPLCGKSVDLAWLAEQGTSVVGVELVEDAARAFFEEASVSAERTQQGSLIRYASKAGRVEIVVGNFFEVTSAEVGTFDAAYDRAALVALPAELRVRYVKHLRTLLEPAARVFLVSFEHDADANQPPFSVPTEEVRTLWSGAQVELLEETDQTHVSTNLVARGAKQVRELAWRIELPHR